MKRNSPRADWFFPIEEAPVLVAVTHKGVARDVRVPHKKALIAADTGDMVHAFPTTKGEWTEVKVPFKLFTGSWRGTELPDKTFDPAKIRRLDLQLSVPACSCPFRLFHLGAPCLSKRSPTQSRVKRRGWPGCGPPGRILFPA